MNLRMRDHILNCGYYMNCGDYEISDEVLGRAIGTFHKDQIA